MGEDGGFGAEVTRVKLRARQTLGPTGPITTLLSFHCPYRSCTVTIPDCEACDHCAYVRLDATQSSAFVDCGARALPTTEIPGDTGPTTIMEIMPQQVVCVTPETTLRQVLALFVERAISGVPVVDPKGFPVGTISKTDLLRSQHAVAVAAADGADAPSPLDKITVQEVMAPVSISLPETAPVSQGAAIMYHEGVHRIPVTADSGQVVGIVTPLDILGMVAKEHGYMVRGPKD